MAEAPILDAGSDQAVEGDVHATEAGLIDAIAAVAGFPGRPFSESTQNEAILGDAKVGADHGKKRFLYRA